MRLLVLCERVKRYLGDAFLNDVGRVFDLDRALSMANSH